MLILSDEVYEHLIYDDIPHLSILRYPDLAERSFVCFSFGKVYHCTGWKLGYCVSAPGLMAEFRKIHQYNCFSCHTPSQVGMSKFLSNKDSYSSLGNFLQQKRDYFQELMSQTSFIPLPSHGSYFQLYQYDQISQEADVDFAIRLIRQYGVAAIPVSAFYQAGNDNKVLRFCFAKKPSTLELAVERLTFVR
jgi:methionine aminotransferase